MNETRQLPDEARGGLRWFCVVTQPRHEHIAAAHLRKDDPVEVFLPRIKHRRPTSRGPQWMTEALFPGYLFARFDLVPALRRVQHARGVRGVVHFGDGWPAVPDDVIAELKRIVGGEDVHVLTDEFVPGEEIAVATGAFKGLQAVVTRYLAGRERVAVLLEFLGRQTHVELPKESVFRKSDSRRIVIGS